ncbi:MAG: InlB B-repeat-containing protein, partial [Blautia sp.]|nr:InlB B-repeat-containing protein [Blautia sp.]
MNKYKLIYQVDGEEYKSYEIEFGASITPEAAPTKEGYTFSGWSGIP